MAEPPQPPTPRPRVTRSLNPADRHTNAKSSLSLKWEDFFGSSVDLTSGVLNALDTFTTEIDIDEPLPEDEELQLHTVHTGNERSSDITDLSPSESQLGSSPTDIVLLNALPTTSLRHLTTGSRSSCTAPPPVRPRSTLPSSTSNSNGTPLPTPRLLNTSSSQVDSGYASEEAVPAAAAAAGTSSTSIPSYRSATLPCRGRAAKTNQKLRQDIVPAVKPVSRSPQRNTLHGSAPDNSACDTPPALAVPQPALPASVADMDTASRVVMELVETERAYVKDLELIVQGYMEPMVENERFSADSVSKVFCVLPDLLKFHRDLLVELVSAQDTISIEGYAPLAVCFVDNRQRFQCYTHYCTNFPKSLSHLEELLRLPEGQEFFSGRQRELQQMLPLQTFLLKPVQRILKYHLLLQSLAKALGDPEPSVLRAASCMTDVAAHINELQRRHEHALRVQQLQSLLKSAQLDLGSLGELVLEDSFRVHGKKGNRQVFLFHKAILLGKRLENGMLAIKEVINCANLMLVESIPKEPMSFHVLPFDNPKAQQTLQARKVDQKRKWCQEIKRLILENYNTAIPEKAKQLVLNMTPEGGVAPVPSPTHRYQRRIEVSGPYGHGNGSNSAYGVAEDWEDSPQLVSRCFSSTEDLVTLHEEAWQELLRRNVYTRDQVDSCSSSQDSDSEGDILLDGDLRCIAVEINEEVMGGGSMVRGHRRQPSAGRAVDMSIDTSVSVERNSFHSNSHSSTLPNSVASGGSSSRSSNPIYIHCPVGGYDQLVFGKAYQEYIEKTKEKIALSPSDIDEIFRPLRELHVEVDSPVSGGPGGNGSASQPSSADSSPRHIVSRIATSNNCLAAATATRVIQVEPSGSRSEENLSQSPPTSGSGGSGKNSRSQSVVGSMLGGLKSALRKTSSNSSMKHHGSNSSVEENSNNADDTVPQLPRKGFVSTLLRAYSSSGSPKHSANTEELPPSPKNRPEKPSRKLSAPPSNGVVKNEPPPRPSQRPQISRQNTTPAPPKPPSIMRQNTSPEHQPYQQSGTLRRKKNQAPPPPTPPQSTSSNSLNGHTLPSEPQTADEVSLCRGRLRAAMTDLLDSLPYADDEPEQPAAHRLERREKRGDRLDPTVAADRRATGEWAADNIYWKRALLDTKPTAHPAPEPPPPRRTGLTSQQQNNSSRTQSLRVRPVKPPAPHASSATLVTRKPASEGEEESEEAPRRGTVKNMISRFQQPT